MDDREIIKNSLTSMGINKKDTAPHNYEERYLFHEFVNLITVYPGWDSNPQPKR